MVSSPVIRTEKTKAILKTALETSGVHLGYTKVRLTSGLRFEHRKKAPKQPDFR